MFTRVYVRAALDIRFICIQSSVSLLICFNIHLPRVRVVHVLCCWEQKDARSLVQQVEDQTDSQDPGHVVYVHQQEYGCRGARCSANFSRGESFQAQVFSEFRWLEVLLTKARKVLQNGPVEEKVLWHSSQNNKSWFLRLVLPGCGIYILL